MINLYRTANRVAQKRALEEDSDIEEISPDAPPDKQQKTMDQNDQAQNQEDPATRINNGGSGAQGSGAAIQSTAPIFKPLPQYTYTMTFKNRHYYTCRNTTAGEWKRFQQKATDLQNSEPAVQNVWLQWTDMRTIPTHVLGFYMTSAELSHFYNPAVRTFKIKEAKTSIEGVQVFLTQQQGGTDLRYITFVNVDPYVYFPPRHNSGIQYPYYSYCIQDGLGPGNGNTDPDPARNMADHLITKMVRARNGRQEMLRYGVAYHQFNNIYEGGDVGIKEGFGGDGDRNATLVPAWNLRHLTWMPVTNLKGMQQNQTVWGGEYQVPLMEANNSTIVESQGTNFKRTGMNILAGSEQFNELTHQYARGTVVEVQVPSRHNLDYLRVQPDVRQQTNGGPLLSRMSMEQFALWPVGPMHNNTYHDLTGSSAEFVEKNGWNEPLTFGTQDITDPDGKVQDYTIEIILESSITIEFNMKHLGGDTNPRLWQSGFYDPDTFMQQNRIFHHLRRAGHHMYGGGGWAHNHIAENLIFTNNDDEATKDTRKMRLVNNFRSFENSYDLFEESVDGRHLNVYGGNARLLNNPYCILNDAIRAADILGVVPLTNTTGVFADKVGRAANDANWPPTVGDDVGSYKPTTLTINSVTADIPAPRAYDLRPRKKKNV